MNKSHFSIPAWPAFSDEEVQAVGDVLRSGKVNYWNGQICREFEKEFAQYCHTEYAIAVMNGTVSLELALRAMGVGAGDEVVTSPRSFMASASCIVAVGAVPIFADIAKDSGNITAETIAAVLSERTKAIIPIHLAGWPCDMDPIMDLAKQNELFVLEDCAQAHGATYKGRPVGSIGHVGSYSFCTDKIMTLGGEGGMVVTNDKELWDFMWSYKDHGKSYDAVYNKKHADGFRWVHESWGTNWRMTEMQGAIGRIQLRKLNSWKEARQKNAAILTDRLSSLDCIRVPQMPNHSESPYYKFYIYIKPELLASGWSRDKILGKLSEQGVPGLSGSCSEMYLEKPFAKSGYEPKERLPAAKELGETSVLFMVHPTISEKQMKEMSNIIYAILESASL
jgi:dTDP-4-amino-4,6-dideoxygalactose transaminase